MSCLTHLPRVTVTDSGKSQNCADESDDTQEITTSRIKGEMKRLI